jgi:hypothetical protein
MTKLITLIIIQEITLNVDYVHKVVTQITKLALWEVGEGERQYIMKNLEKSIMGEVEMEVGGKETLNKCGSRIYIYYFILMVMELHGAHGCDMDHFFKVCARLFHDRRSRGHLSLFFWIQIFIQHVSFAFQRVLTFVLQKKIMSASDACSKPPIIIRSHDLCAGDIKGAMGEIGSYQERD